MQVLRTAALYHSLRRFCRRQNLRGVLVTRLRLKVIDLGFDLRLALAERRVLQLELELLLQARIDEAPRLAALHALGVLDTAPQQRFDVFTTRACERFFDVAFDELGLHRMELQAASGNLRSRAVAGRLGMFEEGVARDGIRVADGYLDSIEYGILEDEWRARRVPM